MYLRRAVQLFHINSSFTSQVRFARKPMRQNPGIDKRAQLLEDDSQQIEELTDYDFDLEADFMQAGKSYGQHMSEMRSMRERKKYMIVERKYFKQKTPNFLTWSDKQQIRYLYNNNPDEWSVEKLSEGFPVLPHVITKIVKGNWVVNNDNRIERHDESVKENWKQFKEGKLKDLPDELVQHLKKFTDRNVKPFEVPEMQKPEAPTPSLLQPNIRIGSEFSEIITSYKKLQADNSSKGFVKATKKNKAPEDDTYLLDHKSKFSKPITLDKLQDKIEAKAEQGKKLTEDEALMLMGLQNTEDVPIVDLTKNSVKEVKEIVEAGSNSSVATITRKRKDYEFLKYPEQITIPKNKLKRGCTYKLNDCYYDDDGEFLYRVPGMY